jgi:hypothetical protein
MNKLTYESIATLTTLSPKMGGVFSTADLQSILNTKEKASFFYTLSRLQDLKVITRFTKGIYITKDYSPRMLSARIDPDAYISMGSVLAQNGVLGTIPAKILTAVRVGRNRSYVENDLTVRHYGISRELYFGFSTIEGIKVADNEKAYIDLLYYRMRGARYPFDELTDVNLDMLDLAKCNRYLKKYRNSRFVTFCTRIFNG